MFGKECRKILISGILSFSLLLQLICIPVIASDTEKSSADAVHLIAAENQSGSSRNLIITFSAPIRFTDDNPRAHIYASSTESTAGDSNIGLVTNDNSCFAINPVMVAGYTYSSEYALTFSSDLDRVGVLRITDDVSSLNGSTISAVCDALGNELAADAKGQNEAEIQYEIPEMLLGAKVVSPTQAVLFFNYDTEFLAGNPCDYITADDSQTADMYSDASKIKAQTCEKIDKTRYLITFTGVLPDTGNIYIRDGKKTDDGTISIVGTSDGSAKLVSRFVDDYGYSIAAATFSNPYMQIVKTEYREDNKARIYFPEKTRFLSLDPASNVIATNYGMPDASSDNLWIIDAKSVTPVDGTMDSEATAYDVTFSQNVIIDCNICITGAISPTDNSLRSVINTVDGKSLYSEYQYTASDNSIIGMALVGYKTRFIQPDLPVSVPDAEVVPAAVVTPVIDNSSTEAVQTVVDVEPSHTTSFTKAAVIDTAQRLVRLYFSSPVHIGSSIAVCDSAQSNQWAGSIDTSYAPLYENPYEIDGVMYSDSIVVKFGDLQSVNDTSKAFNDNILPGDGTVAIDSNSIIDSAGLSIISNWDDSDGNKLSCLQYTTDTYAKIIKAEAIDKDTARITFSESVIFQSDNPQKYIRIVQSVIADAPEMDCVSVTPVDGTMESGATTYDITYAASVIMPISIKLVEELSELKDDKDVFAIGGLVKAVNEKLVAATNYEDNCDEANIAFTVYYTGGDSGDPSTNTGVQPNPTPTVPDPAPVDPTPIISDPTPIVPIPELAVSEPAPTETDSSPISTEPGLDTADGEAPSAPTTVVLQTVSTTAVSLSWDLSTDNIGTTGYNILRNGVQVGTSETNNYSDSDLAQGTTYTYELQAFDAAGNISGTSTPLLVTTLCSVKDFLGYSINGVSGIIDNTAGTILITLPKGTDLTALTAAFSVSDGAQAVIGSTLQTSAETTNDYTNPVVYTILAKDGSTQNYTVTAIIETDSAIPETTGTEPITQTTDTASDPISTPQTPIIAGAMESDTTPPTITAAEQTTWTSGNVTVNTTITDSQSGVATKKWAAGTQTIAYFASSGTTFTGSSFTVTANGTYTVYAKDNAGNEAVQTVIVTHKDTTAPTITAAEQTTWTSGSVTVNTTITDSQSGVATQKWVSGTQNASYFTLFGTTYTGNSFTVTSNGTYTVYGKDSVGNTTVQTVTVTHKDTTGPTITAAEQTTWTNGNVTVNTTITDSQSGVAIQKWAAGSQSAAYFVSSGTTYTGNSFTVTANGTYTVYGKDNVGNTTTQTVSVSHKETTPPTISLSTSWWWGQTNTITAYISDSQSGVAIQKWAAGTQTASYFTSSGTTFTGSSFTVAANGIYTVYAKDNAGNEAVQTVVVSYVDTTAPTITAAEQTTWTNGNVTVNTTITDSQSGVATTKWASGTQTSAYFSTSGTTYMGSSFTVTANGTYTVYSRDNVGNETVQTVVVSHQDTSVPTITAAEQTTWTNGSVSVSTTITVSGKPHTP